MSKNTFEEEIKKLKQEKLNYGYDSLCLRYKLAREAQARAEYIEARQNNNMTHDQDYYKGLADRDCMRFFAILDDLIGGHE